MSWRAASAGNTAKVGDYARYPGASLLLTCTACGFSKDYNPERVIDRLRELREGGHATYVFEVAQCVRSKCPGCGGANWRADFVWPAGMSDAEIKRIAARYRS